MHPTYMFVHFWYPHATKNIWTRTLCNKGSWSVSCRYFRTSSQIFSSFSIKTRVVQTRVSVGKMGLLCAVHISCESLRGMLCERFGRRRRKVDAKRTANPFPQGGWASLQPLTVKPRWSPHVIYWERSKLKTRSSYHC